MDLKQTIADNIAFYRKEIGLTQAGLAEKLNYSDKAISKWERAESYPDIATLVVLAKLFNVTVDDLVTDKKKVKKVKPLVALLSSALVWLIATAAYVILNMILPGLSKSWLAFVYAVPVTTIVLLVFFAIWGLKFAVLIDESVMIWTIALCIFLTLSIQGAFYIFFLPIPLQIMAILWYVLRVKHKVKMPFKRSRIKNSTENDNTTN